jgi:DNA-binding MarR family transcriptional regulator
VTSPNPKRRGRGPRIGALLRLCHQAFVNELTARLQQAGQTPVLGAVTQPLWDHPEGMRLTELADYAGITKQSMGELVDKVEAVGYVERVADPIDRRGVRIRFTRKGLKVARATRALVLELESEWARSIGRPRLESLRETLAAILEHKGPAGVAAKLGG